MNWWIIRGLETPMGVIVLVVVLIYPIGGNVTTGTSGTRAYRLSRWSTSSDGMSEQVI